MLISVERCTKYFRLTLPCGGREFVSYRLGEFWTRAHATEALNVLQHVYGFSRKAIRFDHVN